MTTTMLIVLILVVEIVATPNFSRFCLRNHPKITIESLGKIHPKLGNLATCYAPLTFIIFLVTVILFLIIMTAFGSRGTISLILLLGSPFVAITFFDGVLALITNIYPATTRTKWEYFVYSESKSLQWIAKTQIGIAILEIVVSIIACYVYRWWFHAHPDITAI
jgi:hypothetical protein